MITHQQIAHPPIKSNLISHSDKNHTFTIEPLLPGFGYTLGNSLRRILLSSVPGFAVTKVRINDLTHEYQTIEGVVEDAMQVILNIKLLRAKILTDDDHVTLTLTTNSEGDVYASDFQKEAKVRIANPDLYICSVNKGGKLTIDIDIERGIGYRPIEELDQTAITNPLDIHLDAVFSPVTNVQFQVNKVRVGDKTNYDKVEVTFDTDKSVEAQEVIDFVLTMLVDQYSKMKSSFESATDLQTYTTVQSAIKSQTVTPGAQTASEPSGSAISLSPRIKSILDKAGITTNEALTDRIDEVEDLPGIGESAMTKIHEYIKTL